MLVINKSGVAEQVYFFEQVCSWPFLFCSCFCSCVVLTQENTYIMANKHTKGEVGNITMITCVVEKEKKNKERTSRSRTRSQSPSPSKLHLCYCCFLC